MSGLIGLEGKVFYAAGGVPTSSSSYLELTITENVEASDTRDESGVKLRGQENVLYEVGHVDSPVTFTTLYDPADPGYMALSTAYLTRAVIGLAFLDGVVEASQTGFEGDYKLSERTKPQPVDGVWMVNWKAVPALDGTVKPRAFVHTA